MGLFTNRKSDGGNTDFVSSRDAIDALRQRDELDDVRDEPGTAVESFESFESFHPDQSDADQTEEVTGDQADAGGAFDGVDLDGPDPTASIPDEAAPFVDDELDDEGAALALAEVGISLEETEPELPPGPTRRSSNYFVSNRTVRPDDSDPAQADIDIDVDGLLELLGVAPGASLSEISEARLRFLDAHDPQAETRADAAEIKERIRRQINTAYATFRLTRAG